MGLILALLPWTSQDSDREGDESFEQLKNRIHSDSDKPEWNQKKPYDRIKKQSDQCKWPAEHQKNQPK